MRCILHMKRYFLCSNGCYLNKIDTKRIELLLNNNGWVRSDKLKDADTIIFNTCAYNQGKDDECIQKIEEFKKTKDKKTKLVIGGCLPIINKSRMAAIFKGPSFTPHTLPHLCSIMNIDKVRDLPSAQKIETDDNNYDGNIKDAFCIRIAYGCLGQCSFCAVKAVFPKFASKKKLDIIKEFKAGLKKRYDNIFLTAEDTSVYGFDIKTNLALLSKDLVAIKGEFVISLYRLNPEGLLKIGSDFIEVLKSRKILFLSIPVNSGSNKIIKLMNRNYKVKKTKDYIKRLKEAAPFVKINLDLMVGFPGETKRDFMDTLKFVLETNPHSVRVFQYTDRPNAPTRYLKRKISSDVMKRRSMMLHRILKISKASELLEDRLKRKRYNKPPQRRVRSKKS